MVEGLCAADIWIDAARLRHYSRYVAMRLVGLPRRWSGEILWFYLPAAKYRECCACAIRRALAIDKPVMCACDFITDFEQQRAKLRGRCGLARVRPGTA